MKRVLILGASGGIGAAVFEILKREPAKFEVTGVTRRERKIAGMNTISGNLTDATFRARLADSLQPHIVIATYGRHPNEKTTYMDAINEFAISTIDLYERFEDKGELEKFVAVSSLIAQATSVPHVFTSNGTHKYCIAKRMLSDFFRQVQLYMKSKSEVILLEPGYIRTDFAEINQRIDSPQANDFLTRTRIQPVDPAIIAEDIYRAITQTGGTTLSKTYFNRSSQPV